jgi:mRNA degradation ribonuclease J1/J2
MVLTERKPVSWVPVQGSSSLPGLKKHADAQSKSETCQSSHWLVEPVDVMSLSGGTYAYADQRYDEEPGS